MNKFVLILGQCYLLLSLFGVAQVQAQDADKECVILLHGLARTHDSMNEIEDVLKSEGYQVVNYNYPSTEFRIETLAETAISNALSLCLGGRVVNFVTHSMGGILVRQYLSQNKLATLGRVVMLAPPNHGSEVVDRLHTLPGFELMQGVAGHQLGTDVASVPNILGPADFEVGIIAGTYTVNFILSMLIPKPNDGKVSVASTRLNGMNDHITMPVTHTFMMSNDNVVRQVLYFLKLGRFERVHNDL